MPGGVSVLSDIRLAATKPSRSHGSRFLSGCSLTSALTTAQGDLHRGGRNGLDFRMMFLRKVSRIAPLAVSSHAAHFFVLGLALLAIPALASAQAKKPDASSSSSSSSSSSASSGQNASSASGPAFAQEKAPSLVDPAGPAIELVNSEQLFFMAATLNACGYDEGLAESDPVRQQVRGEVNQALAASEDARDKRDKVCLYIAQHRMTGTIKDISQYISLALYLTPPPELDTSVELPQMPPDSTQVVEILPLLRDFAAAVDLHGIWLTHHRGYDEIVSHLHDALTQMILSTNYYLKMPASTYDGRRFLVVVEPQLNPHTINARIYGTDFVDVVSPVNGQIRMNDVRHTYLHYLIEPLLYQRSSATDRFLPIMKEVRDAPLDYRLHSDIVDLTIECLIKAVEARTMDTGIKPYVAPKDEKRSDFERIESERNAVNQKMEQVRVATVRHDMAQGFVLTAYFYEQLIQFEKDPASLKDTIGELVYSMDVDHEIHRARAVTFDSQADDDVLRRSAPRKLTGLDLAEARLAAGDYATASAMARQSLSMAPSDETVDSGRANFILARAAILTGHPDDAMAGFQKAAATAKETRVLAWSHIYLGRMMDLDCKRDEAIAQYKEALAVRDGQQDTRLAADRGIKAAYAVKGHTCEDDAGSDGGEGSDSKPPASNVPASSPPSVTAPK
jgi:tetratricopeptide (TPR) repeat protein